MWWLLRFLRGCDWKLDSVDWLKKFRKITQNRTYIFLQPSCWHCWSGAGVVARTRLPWRVAWRGCEGCRLMSSWSSYRTPWMSCSRSLWTTPFVMTRTTKSSRHWSVHFSVLPFDIGLSSQMIYKHPNWNTIQHFKVLYCYGLLWILYVVGRVL